MYCLCLCNFQHPGTGAHGWASEFPDVKNYKRRLNPVWHRMLYSCTRMATVGVKGLTMTQSVSPGRLLRVFIDYTTCVRWMPTFRRHSTPDSVAAWPPHDMLSITVAS